MHNINMNKHKTIGTCPICGGDMSVVKLDCDRCGSSLTGQFEPCEFCQLDNDSLSFLRTFLRCRGNIKEVERTLKISYPTVKGRLDNLLGKLGYAPIGAAFSAGGVLNALGDGKISVSDALEHIQKREPLSEEADDNETKSKDQKEGRKHS